MTFDEWFIIENGIDTFHTVRLIGFVYDLAKWMLY